MHTDIPLKRLTALCGADLLPLLGLPHAELLSVETLELPASQLRLDIVLRVRSPGGQIYRHIIEWQGYRDRAILWRLAYYIVWTGREYPQLPVVGTVVYLTPDEDMGDTLTQTIDGVAVQTWPMHCVRLWELDAQTALESGKPGLAVLSPLMAHATPGLVEQAITVVLTETPLPQQSELLTILGILAEGIVGTERFVRLVGRERLMESTLLEYLIEERTAELRAELQAEFTARESELAARLQAEVEARHRAETEARLQAEVEARHRAETEARLQAEVEARHRAETEARLQAVVIQLQQALQETLVTRFPQLPPTLLLDVQQVMDPMVLSQLSVTAVRVSDLAAFERALQQARVEL